MNFPIREIRNFTTEYMRTDPNGKMRILANGKCEIFLMVNKFVFPDPENFLRTAFVLFATFCRSAIVCPKL